MNFSQVIEVRKINARNSGRLSGMDAIEVCDGYVRRRAHNWENGVNKTKNRRGAEEAR